MVYPSIFCGNVPEFSSGIELFRTGTLLIVTSSSAQSFRGEQGGDARSRPSSSRASLADRAEADLTQCPFTGGWRMAER